MLEGREGQNDPKWSPWHGCDSSVRYCLEDAFLNVAANHANMRDVFHGAQEKNMHCCPIDSEAAYEWVRQGLGEFPMNDEWLESPTIFNEDGSLKNW
jgi:hypothetical protein